VPTGNESFRFYDARSNSLSTSSTDSSGTTTLCDSRGRHRPLVCTQAMTSEGNELK
jgi:hypothetical protein